MGRFVPLSIPNFEGNERKYVDDALDQGWVSTGGAYITELEEKLAEFLQVKKTAAVQSGTSALHLSLIVCGVQPGDMVIVPTLTFIAAVNPVRYQFAEPVFMDCDDSLCMDPLKLRRFCENECVTEDGQLKHRATGKTVKAIVVVHVFGNMADMEAIMDTPDFVEGHYDTGFITKNGEHLQQCIMRTSERAENIAMIAAYMDYLMNLEENRGDATDNRPISKWKEFGLHKGVLRI